ncbi:hypothetical protein THAOC_04923, partial [Thalassiosira oceanica]
PMQLVLGSAVAPRVAAYVERREKELSMVDSKDTTGDEDACVNEEVSNVEGDRTQSEVEMGESTRSIK